MAAAVAAPLRPEEERLFEGQPKGFPLDGFALEDVMLPEDDDMDIPSEEEEDEEEEIQTESGFGSVVGTGVVSRVWHCPPGRRFFPCYATDWVEAT